MSQGYLGWGIEEVIAITSACDLMPFSPRTRVARAKGGTPMSLKLKDGFSTLNLMIHCTAAIKK